jgi:hypothetical protein
LTRDASGSFLNANSLTWTELKVSGAHWTTSTIPTPGYDYIGVASGDGRTFPVWSDDRSSTNNFNPWTSWVLLWGVKQDSVSASYVNVPGNTIDVTVNWKANLHASAGDQLILTSPAPPQGTGTTYTSSVCTTCGGLSHTLTFAGIPCEPGYWTYTVVSRRSGCSQNRVSDPRTFRVVYCLE